MIYVYDLLEEDQIKMHRFKNAGPTASGIILFIGAGKVTSGGLGITYPLFVIIPIRTVEYR
jgi:hypothetical protein